MPQSLSSVLVHVVFSTKHREALIRDPVDSEVYAYGTTVLKNADCPTLAMNGTADHIHALFSLSRVKTIVEVHVLLVVGANKIVKGVSGNRQHGLSIAFGVVEPIQKMNASRA